MNYRLGRPPVGRIAGTFPRGPSAFSIFSPWTKIRIPAPHACSPGSARRAPLWTLRRFSLRAREHRRGFRRYFRVTGKDGATFIVMDAPPEHGGMEPFVRVTELMHEAGLHAPKIFASDLKEGFLLLSDLGRETYLNVLNEENAFSLMDDATTALVAWQKISRPGVLPEYDREVLLREVNLFPEWYVGRHKGHTFTEEENRWWKMTIDAVIENNLREARCSCTATSCRATSWCPTRIRASSTIRTRSTGR